jgi:hypothetical protein
VKYYSKNLSTGSLKFRISEGKKESASAVDVLVGNVTRQAVYVHV